MSSLRDGLNSFCRAALHCNFLEWNGAPKRRTRIPPKRGSGSVENAAIAFYVHGGARILLRGRAFGRHCSALRSHPVSFRLSLLQKPLIHSVIAGLKMIEFILSTKKVVNKEIPFCG